MKKIFQEFQVDVSKIISGNLKHNFTHNMFYKYLKIKKKNEEIKIIEQYYISLRIMSSISF